MIRLTVALFYSEELFMKSLLKISETWQLLSSKKKKKSEGLSSRNFSQSGNSETISAGHIPETLTVMFFCGAWIYREGHLAEISKKAEICWGELWVCQ